MRSEDEREMRRKEKGEEERRGVEVNQRASRAHFEKTALAEILMGTVSSLLLVSGSTMESVTSLLPTRWISFFSALSRLKWT